MKKRFISMILALLMVIGMIPVNAFAAGESEIYIYGYDMISSGSISKLNIEDNTNYEEFESQWYLLSDDLSEIEGMSNGERIQGKYYQYTLALLLKDPNAYTNDAEINIDGIDWISTSTQSYPYDGQRVMEFTGIYHAHNGVLVPGYPASYEANGRRDYWQCSCGARTVDEEGLRPVYSEDVLTLLSWDENDIVIDEANFPDVNFREYVKEFDHDKNGALSQMEIIGITAIDVNNMEISSLKGIEHFEYLESLICYNNALTELDLTENTLLEYVDCYSNKIARMYIGVNPNLTFLNIMDNELYTIYTGGAPNLEYLYFASNNFTSFIFTENIKLRTVSCSRNPLGNIDVSMLPDLDTFECAIIGAKSLDISKNTKLEYLNCESNEIESLDISNNPNLIVLYCSSNQITSLDTSKNPELTDLMIAANKLQALDLTNNPELEYLTCLENELESIELSSCSKLIRIFCSDNKLTDLDVRNNTEITSLIADDNLLTGINLEYNTKLNYLSLNDNPLAALDITNNGLLESLYLRFTDLKELDLSNNGALTTLDLSGTKLDELVLGPNSVEKVEVNIGSEIQLVSSTGTPLPPMWTSGSKSIAVNGSGKVTVNAYDRASVFAFDLDSYLLGSCKIQPRFNDVLALAADAYGNPNKFSEGVSRTGYTAVYWAADKGITKGYSADGTFRPDADISRVEMVIMLWRLAGTPEPDMNNVPSFKDMSDIKGQTQTKAIYWAYQTGITRGYSDGTFRPKDSIKREEIAIFIYRLARLQGRPNENKVSSTTFVDSDKISSKGARVAIEWAVKEGIIKGYTKPKGYFGPQDPCKRIQMAIMLIRYANELDE